jgi:hypothetical protein
MNNDELSKWLLSATELMWKMIGGWKATTSKNDDKKKRYRPATRMPEAASSETGNKEKFILKQSCGSLEHGPTEIKRAKTVSSFKYAYRRHRENIVENA